MSNALSSLVQDALCLLKETLPPSSSLWIPPSQVQHYPLLQQKTPPRQRTLPPHTPKSSPPLTSPKLAPEERPAVREEVKHTPPTVEEKTAPEKLPIPSLPIEEFSRTAHTLFPHFSLRTHPLCDETPYLSALQAHVVILSLRESRESDLFLQNLRVALHAYFPSAQIFDLTFFTRTRRQAEIPFFFEHLQASLLITPQLASKDPLFLPWLAKKNPLLLDPFETYFTNAEKKKSLWHLLCNTLKTPNTQASS